MDFTISCSVQILREKITNFSLCLEKFINTLVKKIPENGRQLVLKRNMNQEKVANP